MPAVVGAGVEVVLPGAGVGVGTVAEVGAGVVVSVPSPVVSVDVVVVVAVFSLDGSGSEPGRVEGDFGVGSGAGRVRFGLGGVSSGRSRLLGHGLVGIGARGIKTLKPLLVS